MAHIRALKEYLKLHRRSKSAHWQNMLYHVLFIMYMFYIYNMVAVFQSVSFWRYPDDGRNRDRNIL